MKNYSYKTTKEETGKPEISKEELGNIIWKEIINDTLGEADIENNKFKENFYVVRKLLLVNDSCALPLVTNFVYDST